MKTCDGPFSKRVTHSPCPHPAKYKGARHTEMGNRYACARHLKWLVGEYGAIVVPLPKKEAPTKP